MLYLYREQIPAFSPYGDQRRKSNVHLSRTDIEKQESKDTSIIQLINKESKKWVVRKSTENLRDGIAIRDQREDKNGLQTSLADTVMKEEEEEEEKAMAEEKDRLVEEEEEEGEIEEEERERDRKNKDDEETETDLNIKERGNLGLVVLQWGHRKRARCSRVDNNNNNNHHVMKSVVAEDQSSVLTRKVVRVKKTEKAESFVKAKSGSNRASSAIPEGQEQSGEGRGRVKTLRKASLEGSKTQTQNSNPKHREKALNSHTKPLTLTLTPTPPPPPPPPPPLPPPPTIADHNTKSDSPDRANTSDLSASTKVRIDLPKIVLSLSRKEKEDDFLVIKGTKLPQRPKRRPKAIEKLLHVSNPYLIGMLCLLVV